MRYSIVVLVTFLSAMASAFPAAALESVPIAARNSEIQGHIERTLSALQATRETPSFDPAAQLVSTTGQHAFVPPNFAAGDQRGNCPGLNAMANHGYIPHNGVATTAEFVEGCFNVFGMGRDLGLVLSTFGSVMNGDLTKFSIGGPSQYVPGVLGLLGTPQGISANNSHNKYEGDVSATRGDLYLYGDTSKLVMCQFQQLFDMQPDPKTANYDLSVILPFHASRFQNSVENNPYFFQAPLSGTIAASAAHNFIYRMFSNKSHEHPEGILNQEVLKSFFAISGPSRSFTYTEGAEQIPENWYRCPPSSPYDFPHAIADIVAAGLVYPQLLSIGGNTGTPNSFTGANIAQLTGGVFNAASLLEGDTAVCFALQAARLGTPDLVSGPKGLLTGLLSPLLWALNGLSAVVTNVLVGLSCPVLRTYDQSVFEMFPGARQGRV